MECHAAAPGEPPPVVGGREVYGVGSPSPRPAIEAVARHAGNLTGRAPHLTAAPALDGVIRTDGVVDGIADVGRSGRLPTRAWCFRDPPPRALRAVHDRDLWRFARPWTRAIALALTAYPCALETWEARMGEERLEAPRQAGITPDRRPQKATAEAIAGHTVPACNVPPIWASDAGPLPAPGQPCAACCWIDGERIAVSLRATPDGFDVSEVAKRFGGGGHPHAAGFKRPWTGSRSIEP